MEENFRPFSMKSMKKNSIIIINIKAQIPSLTSHFASWRVFKNWMWKHQGKQLFIIIKRNNTFFITPTSFLPLFATLSLRLGWLALLRFGLWVNECLIKCEHFNFKNYRLSLDNRSECIIDGALLFELIMIIKIFNQANQPFLVQ